MQGAGTVGKIARKLADTQLQPGLAVAAEARHG